jgi:hypothetical protein
MTFADACCRPVSLSSVSNALAHAQFLRKSVSFAHGATFERAKSTQLTSDFFRLQIFVEDAHFFVCIYQTLGYS